MARTNRTLDKELIDIQNQLYHLSHFVNRDTIGNIDAVMEELKKKEYELKKKLVLDVHPYQIRTGKRQKNKDKNYVYYTTTCPWLDNDPRVHTEKALIDKLYSYYYGNDNNSFSFKSVFDKALDEKIRTEGIKDKTIRDIKMSYRTFISDELGCKDIRSITPSELKEYQLNLVKEKKLKKKRYYKFKGIFNLVFNYATDPEHRILEYSPVSSNNRPYIRQCEQTITNPEDKAFTLDEIAMIREYVWNRINNSKYDVNGYAILFSSYTGVRQGEIPSLRWEDIKDTYIHIHSQQNDFYDDNKQKIYYYNDSTKNEKGISKGGRKFPITKEIKHILDELKKKQEELGINSEWVFCKENGEWTTTIAYSEALRRVCKGDKSRGKEGLGLKLCNNHAFRIALNSYVLIPMGYNAVERATLLGHTPEVNMKFYTFDKQSDDDRMMDIANDFDDFYAENGLKSMGTGGYMFTPYFYTKEKSPKHA